MDYFSESYALELNPVAPAASSAVFGKLRLTAITNRLLRVEYSKNGVFTDCATQIVWNRSVDGGGSLQAKKARGKIIAETQAVIFTLRAKDGKLVSAYFKDTGRKADDPHEGNLRGTCRTLDQTVGATRLGEGLISREGLTVMEDDSLLLDENSHVSPRESKGSDCYYFAYGHNYRGCLRDFYAITGQVPLIPRYSLANWWSRYKAYTQQEYLELMARFDKEEIPIAVATVDMDWHLVDLSDYAEKLTTITDPRRKRSITRLFQNLGWTGYTWDEKLFPDWRDFLATLQAQGRKVTLNLHPADGVRAFEEPYAKMAEAMGTDPKSGEQICFDITDPRFVEHYFKVLHHPLEDAGVDFWWIDWQQGTKTNIPGLDPLWALNHYHYLDSKRTPDRDGKEKSASKRRPLILSRYAGPGSHRYPLGFSGDTMISWACLRFQPYFTANAANVGYGWWSHDIGGHHMGSKDDELYLRWVQFGVFNPIMRLHSTSNEFMGKEPWKYRDDVYKYTVELLRLRHRLVPYLYSMNKRSHTEGIALCEPLYYTHPNVEAAYKYGNEYYFGSELLCAPVTEKISKHTNLAQVKLWLPEGRWTDIFNGRIYNGGREATLCRGAESIPVLAKEGAIIPLALDGKTNSVANPAELELWLYRGDGEFTLYEDDGESMAYLDGAYRETRFSLTEGENTLRLSIRGAGGDELSFMPQSRTYRLAFRDLVSARSISVTINGKGAEYKLLPGDTLTVELAGISPLDEVELELAGVEVLKNEPLREALIELITKFQCDVHYKKASWTKFIEEPSGEIPGHKRFHAPIRELLELWR
ncbi:MAG: DUF5110 domain-containing protein [Clostridium sp.]|nr:DUF5110 domain-containing protein [Clostridium sp.]